MDWITFGSKVTESLAWPGTLIIVLLVLRKELLLIIKSIRKFKFNDFELEFDEAAKAVAAEAKQAVPVGDPNIRFAEKSREELKSQLEKVAEHSPRAAILEAWLLVEKTAVNVIRKRRGGDLPAMPGPMRLRDSLLRLAVLDSVQADVFEMLRKLRNSAVHTHDAEITDATVGSYIEAALYMASYLESLALDPSEVGSGHIDSSNIRR